MNDEQLAECHCSFDGLQVNQNRGLFQISMDSESDHIHQSKVKCKQKLQNAIDICIYVPYNIHSVSKDKN